MEKTRWWFEGSDLSYSAMDEIVRYLEERLHEIVDELEDDGSIAGAIPPFLFALVSLLECSAGSFRSDLDAASLAKRVLAAYDCHVRKFPEGSRLQFDQHRELLQSLFERLAASGS